MKQLEEWFVPWLKTARKYDTSVLDRAWASPDYGRMMLNENPLPPSEKVIKAVADILAYGNRYPDSMLRLRTKLAALDNLGPENVALCNGSSEIIDGMMRIFLEPGDEFLCSTPTFELYPPRCELAGGKVVSIPLRAGDLQYDTEAMLAAITSKTKLILIISPNNPTGVFIDDADLIRFCETGIPLCLDEAYLDYHPEVSSQASLIKKYPHVFLSHTFSKAYGFAGIRFGYLVGVGDGQGVSGDVSALERKPHVHGGGGGHPGQPGGGKGQGHLQQPLDEGLRRGTGEGGPQALPRPRQLYAHRRHHDRQDHRPNPRCGLADGEDLLEEDQPYRRERRVFPGDPGER